MDVLKEIYDIARLVAASGRGKRHRKPTSKGFEDTGDGRAIILDSKGRAFDALFGYSERPKNSEDEVSVKHEGYYLVISDAYYLDAGPVQKTNKGDWPSKKELQRALKKYTDEISDAVNESFVGQAEELADNPY